MFLPYDLRQGRPDVREMWGSQFVITHDKVFVDGPTASQTPFDFLQNLGKSHSLRISRILPQITLVIHTRLQRPSFRFLVYYQTVGYNNCCVIVSLRVKTSTKMISDRGTGTTLKPCFSNSSGVSFHKSCRYFSQ